MLEHQLRCAIYARTDLKPNSKLALLGVLAVVDWQTWQGPCSAKDVSKRMGMAEPSVRRAFKDLTELNLISRVAKLRETESGKTHHHRAVTKLNVEAIMSDSTLAQNALTPLAQNALTPSAECANPLAQSALTPLAHSALHNNHGYSIEDINQITTEDTQQTSQPDDDAQTVEADEAVEVDESHYPQALRDFARMRKISCAEAQVIVDNMNRKAESVARDRERGVNFNRPTTSYRPY